jgi:hypothetical protein
VALRPPAPTVEMQPRNPAPPLTSDAPSSSNAVEQEVYAPVTSSFLPVTSASGAVAGPCCRRAVAGAAAMSARGAQTQAWR